jgi:hypothetical protein
MIRSRVCEHMLVLSMGFSGGMTPPEAKLRRYRGGMVEARLNHAASPHDDERERPVPSLASALPHA